MATKLPAITGKQLIRLLKRDGWSEHRRTRHGQSLKKVIDHRTRVTVVPDKSSPLPDQTLTDILSPGQTGIGRKGLRELIAKLAQKGQRSRKSKS